MGKAPKAADDVNLTFDRAIDHYRDVSESFWADYGFDAHRAEALLASDAVLRLRVREHMESGQDGGRLFQISDEIGAHSDRARQLLDHGDVAAVDGTTALEKLDFNITTQYACAVAWITSQERGKPHITITETASDYVAPEILRQQPIKDWADLYEAKAQARVQESWPRAFREYMERYTANNACNTSIVILDGPIFTQNLMSQPKGRKLYDAMLHPPKRLPPLSRKYIGVIKNISGSWPECVWSAAALERGEGYIISPVSAPLLRPTESSSWRTKITDWVHDSGMSKFLRIVYRPAEKAFSFECHEDDVQLALAILIADASPTINHELPLLLETVDAQLRSSFNGSAARDMILNRYMSMPAGYRAAVDATDERDYR